MLVAQFLPCIIGLTKANDLAFVNVVNITFSTNISNSYIIFNYSYIVFNYSYIIFLI